MTWRRYTAGLKHRTRDGLDLRLVGEVLMGIYSEYIDRRMDMKQLTAERKRQLKRISELRDNRDILVYAADLRKADLPIHINVEDLLPIADQLSNLHGSALDVILETTGGIGEVAEDIVRLIRSKYEDVAFIVPGTAKSAGTIIVMSGDEILMEPMSSLGPIDAQLHWQGRQFSAEAFLTGLEKIKAETDATGKLNRAYIPILQNISVGEIQNAENALEFARTLVTEWLKTYKFRKWVTHSSTGAAVTEDEKAERAAEIAAELCNHSRWLTHGRSIKIEDLTRMGLKISDYTTQPELFDAIRRYHTLLQMTFDSAIYKVFETAKSQIYRMRAAEQQGPLLNPEHVIVEVGCGKCGEKIKVQLNFAKGQTLEPGCIAYPKDDLLKCPNCGEEHNLSGMRKKVEMDLKKGVVLE